MRISTTYEKNIFKKIQETLPDNYEFCKDNGYKYINGDLFVKDFINSRVFFWENNNKYFTINNNAFEFVESIMVL
jgi:hypothetical protein